MKESRQDYMVEIFLDKKKMWRWRLRYRGFIMADSGEGYSSESNCRRAVRKLGWWIMTAKVVEVDR